MAKYYVQSGNVKTVISADDPQKAALWVVHKSLKQVIPVYEDAELSPDQKSQASLVHGVMVLGNEVQVSEIGFDRMDCAHMDTFDLLVEWHQLMVALERLSEHLDARPNPPPPAANDSGAVAPASQDALH